jgi:hypothetical protein
MSASPAYGSDPAPAPWRIGRGILLAALSIGLVAATGGPQGAGPQDTGMGPQPSTFPASWELEFKFLDPQRIEVAPPGSDRPEVYWYIVYTVINPGPRAQRFFPMFQIVTEDLQVFDTDVGISPRVFEAIRGRHKITHKYLVEPTKVIGALLSGDDNARESVAIWRNIDLSIVSFKVYVAGLSGETQFVPNPGYDPSRPETELVRGPDGSQRKVATNPRHFTLRKTLEISYTLPGSPAARPGVTPVRGQVRWIMR